jgi:hypothetical protein
MHRALAALPILLLTAVPALAADPGTGTVSNAAPKVTWKGTSNAGFITTFGEIFINAAGEKQPCQAPSCDTFTLEVKDVGDLNLQVTGESSITYLQVEKPDGTVVYNDGIEPDGTDPDPVTKLKIKKAPVGSYKVQYAANDFTEETIEGLATLGTPVAAAPAAPATPAAPAAPAAVAAPAPATVSAKAGKLSARKLAKTRKLPLTLTASAPVTAVKVVLASKGKAVATGTLAKLTGTAKFNLKLRKKLKPGRYDLVVEGKDGGATVGTKSAVKVAR